MNKKQILLLAALFFVVALLSLASVIHTISERTRLNELLEEKWKEVVKVEKEMSKKNLLEGDLERKITEVKSYIDSCKKKRVLQEKEECLGEIDEKKQELEIKIVIALNESQKGGRSK